MPLRSWVILALGLILATGTAMSLKSRLASAPAASGGVRVLVATADIPAGSFVRSELQLALVEWPKDHITSQMLTSEAHTTTHFNGAVARRTIQKGEPILKNTLVRSHEGGFMSAVLEPGKRAVSIAVDPTTGNAGFIFPGDHVDLILTHSVARDSAAPTRASETFITDARVLAVDQSLDNPENKAVLAKTVTLEVSPKQAEEITLAKDLGKLSLSLRSLSSRAVPEEFAQGEPPFVEGQGGQGGQGGPLIETLDDLLRSEQEERQLADAGIATTGGFANVTRDTDVSKLIAPGGMAGSRVLVIRGNERSEVVFGAAGGDTRAN